MATDATKRKHYCKCKHYCTFPRLSLAWPQCKPASTKNRKFTYALHAHSQFVYLARFDLANIGMRQPFQPHTFCARLLAFDKTLAKPHFAVVTCSDGVMSVVHSPVLMRCLIFLQL